MSRQRKGMQYRRLGLSGLYVSEFALGTMIFGREPGGCDEPTSIDLVHRYLDAGGNFLDTADIYGPSEEICGRAIRGRRSDVVIGTKVGMPTGRGPHDGGTGRRHIRAACEASLRRLQTDYIDLYQIHFDDIATPLDETIDALDDLVRAGKVLHVGASNFHAFRLMKALSTSDRLGRARFISFQGQYNLIVRTLEREHFGLLAEEELGFVSWSPLAAGMLTGKITRDVRPEGSRLGQPKVSFGSLFMNEHGFTVAEIVSGAAARIGCTPAQLALAWQRTRPVTSVIIGARTPAQLEDNLAALDVEIPDDIAAELEQVSRLPDEYPHTFIDTLQRRLPR